MSILNARNMDFEILPKGVKGVILLFNPSTAQKSVELSYFVFWET